MSDSLQNAKEDFVILHLGIIRSNPHLNLQKEHPLFDTKSIAHRDPNVILEIAKKAGLNKDDIASFLKSEAIVPFNVHYINRIETSLVDGSMKSIRGSDSLIFSDTYSFASSFKKGIPTGIGFDNINDTFISPADSRISNLTHGYNSIKNAYANRIASEEIINQIVSFQSENNDSNKIIKSLDIISKEYSNQINSLIKNEDIPIDHPSLSALNKKFEELRSGKPVFDKVRENLLSLKEPYKYEGDIDGFIADLQERLDKLRNPEQQIEVQTEIDSNVIAQELSRREIKVTGSAGKAIFVSEVKGLTENGNKQTNVSAQLSHDGQSCNISPEVAREAIRAVRDANSDIGAASNVSSHHNIVHIKTQSEIEPSCPSHK